MLEPELTDTIIAEAMERAAAAVCPPLDDRCYGLAFGADEALAERTPSLVVRLFADGRAVPVEGSTVQR